MANFEKLALSKLLTNDLKLLSHLSKQSFNTYSAKIVYTAITKYVEKYSKVPTVDLLLSYLSNQVPEAKKDIVLAYVGSLSKVASDTDTDTIVSGLADAGFIATMDSNIEQLVSAASDRDIEKMKRLLSTLQNAVVFKDTTPVDASSLSFAPEEAKTIESYIPTMRDNGVAFEGLSLISANSGAGKSVFALNQAIYSYLQGYDIVFLNVELSQTQLIARILSFITQKPFKEIVKETDPVKIAELNEIYQLFFSRTNKFKVLNSTLDSAAIKQIIATEKASGLDLVVLDYIQLVENSEGGEEWKFMTRLVKELHQISLQYGVTILTPCQINTEGSNAKSAATVKYSTRNARELELSSSLWLHIEQSPTEFAERMCRLLTLKARNAQKITYVLETAFSTMAFLDTGVTV